jgi:hypothetical protein
MTKLVDIHVYKPTSRIDRGFESQLIKTAKGGYVLEE